MRLVAQVNILETECVRLRADLEKEKLLSEARKQGILKLSHELRTMRQEMFRLRRLAEMIEMLDLTQIPYKNITAWDYLKAIQNRAQETLKKGKG